MPELIHELLVFGPLALLGLHLVLDFLQRKRLGFHFNDWLTIAATVVLALHVATDLWSVL